MTRPHLVGKNGIDGAALSLVAQICETWGDTRDRNFTVARLLLELKPTKKHWDKYSLPFCYSWGKRLIKIAKDRRIAENYDEMPEARTGLYEVALLIDKYFYAALREKIINPSASAQDIRDWLRYKRGAPEAAYANITLQFRCIGAERRMLNQIMDVIKATGRKNNQAKAHVVVRHVRTTNFPPDDEE
jgi:hypothetical protein